MGSWWLSWSILAGMLSDNTPRWPGVHSSLLKTGKDTKNIHVYSDRIKMAEQRLQIGNSFQTLADLEDDDMDISHDIQKPPIKTTITPILPPDD